MRQGWDEDRLVLSELYADDTIPSPLQAAVARLPHRTQSTISYHASIFGFSAARFARLGRVARPHTNGKLGRPPLTPEERAERDAATLRIAEQRKLEGGRRRVEAKAQRKRDRQKAQAAKINAAKKATLVIRATKAADVAKAAIENADRLAREAGIAPLVVPGRTAPIVAAASRPLRLVAETDAVDCNLGDREFIRKRMAFTRDALSGELQRPRNVIEKCMRDVSKSPLDNVYTGGGYTLADLEPAGPKAGRRRAVGM